MVVFSLHELVSTAAFISSLNNGFCFVNLQLLSSSITGVIKDADPCVNLASASSPTPGNARINTDVIAPFGFHSFH